MTGTLRQSVSAVGPVSVRVYDADGALVSESATGGAALPTPALVELTTGQVLCIERLELPAAITVYSIYDAY